MRCRNFQLKELEKFEDVMSGASEGNMHSLTKIITRLSISIANSFSEKHQT